MVKIGHIFGDPNQLDKLSGSSDISFFGFSGDSRLGAATEIHGS